MRPTRIRVAAFLTAAIPLLVLGTASPGSAGGATMTRWSADLSFTGPSVLATLTAAGSTTLLQDYAGEQYYDQGVAVPGKTEPLAIPVLTGSGVCASGSTYVGKVSIYGKIASWSHLGINTSTGANVQVSCLTGGQQHKLYWGARMASGGSWVAGATTNCATLTRTSQTDFTIQVAAKTETAWCPAQDTVVDSRMRFTQDAIDRELPFSATLTVPGLTP